jgi:hypothetical protein
VVGKRIMRMSMRRGGRKKLRNKMRRMWWRK